MKSVTVTVVILQTMKRIKKTGHAYGWGTIPKYRFSMGPSNKMRDEYFVKNIGLELRPFYGIAFVR